MNKKVLVRVLGIQIPEDGGEENRIELIIPGEYSLEGNVHLLVYDESVDETGSLAHNQVRILPTGMIVAKSGAVNTRMIFRPGFKTVGTYTTMMGKMPLEIKTIDYKTSFTENEISVTARYLLWLDGICIASCTIQIQAQEAGNCTFRL